MLLVVLVSVAFQLPLPRLVRAQRCTTVRVCAEWWHIVTICPIPSSIYSIYVFITNDDWQCVDKQSLENRRWNGSYQIYLELFQGQGWTFVVWPMIIHDNSFVSASISYISWQSAHSCRRQSRRKSYVVTIFSEKFGHDSNISHRIHGAAIYGNMDPINIPPMLAYIYQHHGSYGYSNHSIPSSLRQVRRSWAMDFEPKRDWMPGCMAPFCRRWPEKDFLAVKSSC